MILQIKPLSPELLDDYLSFFDQMTFPENPDWSKCYCYSFHFSGPDEDWDKDRNRKAVCTMIKEGKMKGYLAYEADKAVGWCNANDKQNYTSLNMGGDKGNKLCSFVCFVIHPNYRRKGIASKLLKQAIADYSLMGYDAIEAYPRKDTHSCERNYHGHLAMFEKLGFKIEEEFYDYFIVRKSM